MTERAPALIHVHTVDPDMQISDRVRCHTVVRSFPLPDNDMIPFGTGPWLMHLPNAHRPLTSADIDYCRRRAEAFVAVELEHGRCWTLGTRWEGDEFHIDLTLGKPEPISGQPRCGNEAQSPGQTARQVIDPVTLDLIRAGVVVDNAEAIFLRIVEVCDLDVDPESDADRVARIRTLALYGSRLRATIGQNR